MEIKLLAHEEGVVPSIHPCDGSLDGLFKALTANGKFASSMETYYLDQQYELMVYCAQLF